MPPAPPRAAAFGGALFASGYLFPLLKVTEVAMGVLLLSNLFVPLALTVLAPIIVNIVGFHLFLAPAGLGIPLAILAAEIFLAVTYRAAFAPMLRLRTPVTRPARSSYARPRGACPPRGVTEGIFADRGPGRSRQTSALYALPRNRLRRARIASPTRTTPAAQSPSPGPPPSAHPPPSCAGEWSQVSSKSKETGGGRPPRQRRER